MTSSVRQIFCSKKKSMNKQKDSDTDEQTHIKIEI